jgi:cold-inducible RNA-binding protein
MGTKLYVGNLLYEVDDTQLQDLFSQAGSVTSASVIRFRDSGRSKGFGFVEMSTPEEAQAAIDMFNGKDNNGRKLVVSEARPPRPRTDGGDSNDRGQSNGGDRNANTGGDMGGDMGQGE